MMYASSQRNALRVSVVIPTYNRLPLLRRVLAALETQSTPLADFEVIVVSDGATDGTDPFLDTLTTPLQLRPVFQTNSGVAAARNAGVAAARAPLILFLDDDVVPAPDLVAVHLQLHENHDNIVILGPMLTPDDHAMSPWVSWEQVMLYRQYTGHGNRRLRAHGAPVFYRQHLPLTRRHRRSRRL